MLKLATSASKNQAASGLSEGHVMILRYVPHTTYVIYKTNFGTVEYHIPMDHARRTRCSKRKAYLELICSVLPRNLGAHKGLANTTATTNIYYEECAM